MYARTWCPERKERLNVTMTHFHEIDRRVFLTLCTAVATTVLIGSGAKAEGQPPATREDAPNTHNMLVFGEKTIFLSHLPMFDSVTPDKTDYSSPHRYHVILAVSFQSGEQNLQNVYVEDRRTHESAKLYTLNPETFVLPRLFSGSTQRSPLTGFNAKVFRGHLEKGGQVVRGLVDVEVKVRGVVHFRQLNPQTSKPKELTYLLFGSTQEAFLAHYISQPPDFDQVLSVKVDGHRFTDAELAKGIEVTIPGKSNNVTDRVKEAQQVTGRTHTADAKPLRFHLTIDKEIYFEEGELLVPPTFDGTESEKK